MKTDVPSEIVVKEAVAPHHFLLRLTCPWSPESVQPGQFCHLWLPHTSDPLLRRPYSIYRIRDGSLDVLFQVVGKGTEFLAQLDIGDAVRVLGPLGRGFDLPPAGRKALVVGGGVGMASLFLLVERLRATGHDARVLLGARGSDYILCREELPALGVPLDIATDDGSEGFHGFVTDLLADMLNDTPDPSPRPQGASEPWVYACGPTPMMEALSKITLPRGIPTQVALENRMGCALGVCLGCVVPIATVHGVEYQRVCTEGPVFDARAVRWEYRI
jgi:dihydroorotate dehydrogenase electron transfer subunit